MNRKTKEILTQVLFHPAVIALPFALITLFLLPRYFNKVNLQAESSYNANKFGKNTFQHYHDLNHDQVDEEISHFTNGIQQCAIKIRNASGNFKGQWNFNGFLPSKSRNLLYLDYNQDSILDVFTLYQRNDSVFLGGINPEDGETKLLEDFFIDKINVVNGLTDFSSSLFALDLNADGFKEILINLSANFSEQPRKLYAYDFKNKTLNSSPVVGFNQVAYNIIDLDQDGAPELLPSTQSYENIEENLGIPYHDYKRWLVVYNHHLEFKFEPLEMGIGGGSVQSFVFKQADAIKILVSDRSAKEIEAPKIFLFDSESIKLTEVMQEFSPISLTSTSKYLYNNKEYMMLYNSDNGEIQLLDPFDDFKIKYALEIEPGLSLNKQLDINENGQLEFFCTKQIEDHQYLFIYSNDLQYKYVYEVPKKYQRILNITLRVLPSGKKHLVLQLDERLMEFSFNIDKIYLLKNIFLITAIYGFYVLLIWLIMFYQRKILRKAYTKHQQLAELKLKSIRNQLDPHFTFNAINAVASAIMKEDKETAYHYFSMFSQLMRSTMLYSDRMSRKLNDELEFTRQYLDIEKFRFREKFSYQINVDDDVNVNIEVPRMIIQTFAESAVSNGLMHRKTDGLLDIHISTQSDNLLLTFKDNGVGIENSKRLNKAKAFKAYRIMKEFIRIFNDLNHTDISYKMYDSVEGEEYPGTVVEVKLPIIRKYKLIDEDY